MHTALRTILVLALTAALLPGCGSFGTYAKDRIMDLSDIVDVKYGGTLQDGLPVGVGAKFEASSYVGGGLGLAAIPHSREWYGRRSVVSYEGYFVHALILGWDGGQIPLDDGVDATDWYQVVLPVNLSAIDHPRSPPMLQRWRFGGELIVPLVMGGLYLNFGELVDFFAGFGKVDLAGDDGVSITETYGEAFVLEQDDGDAAL